MVRRIPPYLLFWLGGSLSELGSAASSFALILWAYTQTGSALSVSLLSFCSYLPYVLASLGAGGLVGRLRKKPLLLCSDALAAAGSLAALLLWAGGGLALWHLYLINSVLGAMNALQMPARSVAVGLLVPKEHMARASGLDSCSGSLVSLLAPLLASALFPLAGLGGVLALDLLTFLFHFVLLLWFVPIPESLPAGGPARPGCKDGLRYLRASPALRHLLAAMCALNFFSRLTYETILSPMLLARSGGSLIPGLVSALLGLGGIAGGLLITLRPPRRGGGRLIYRAAALSFLLGDLVMGLSRGPAGWCLAALGASLPIPFVAAGQRVLLYRTAPPALQAGVFALRNALQYAAIPAGALLGGLLADRVFEPLVNSAAPQAQALRPLVGTAPGGGMAVMFLCTGLLGALFSLLAERTAPY